MTHDVNHGAKSAAQEETAIFQHVKRAEWGLAIIAWERPTKRAYQFEDGQLRVFKSGFYGLLKQVEQPSERAEAIVAELRRKAGLSQARREQADSAARTGKRLMTLTDQIELFRHEYPGAFAGNEWQYTIRGADARRRLKGHRNPAILAAQESLAASALDGLIAEDKAGEIVEGLVKALRKTTLVRPAEVEALAQLGPAGQQRYAVALRELLHGDAQFALRFERFVAACPSDASWSLVTAPLALYDPTNHICVRPSTFRAQARWMAPRLTISKRPGARLYMRLVEMSQRVAKQLGDEGVAPEDLMDVHDFMRITMRPSAIKALEKLQKKSGGDDPTEAEAA